VVQSLRPAAGAASRHTRREVTSLAELPGARGRSGAQAHDFVMARCVHPVTSVLTEPNSVGRARHATKRSHRVCRRTSGGGGSSRGFGCRLIRSPTAPGRPSTHVGERYRHRHIHPVGAGDNTATNALLRAVASTLANSVLGEVPTPAKSAAITIGVVFAARPGPCPAPRATPSRQGKGP
jgi:hypothetical protein